MKKIAAAVERFLSDQPGWRWTWVTPLPVPVSPSSCP